MAYLQQQEVIDEDFRIIVGLVGKDFKYTDDLLGVLFLDVVGPEGDLCWAVQRRQWWMWRNRGHSPGGVKSWLQLVKVTDADDRGQPDWMTVPPSS